MTIEVGDNLQPLDYDLTPDKERKLQHIEDIEGRFFSWRLSEQQEIDFAWLVKTLKEELKCGK